mgnify:CR=1 FL=1
MRHHEQLSHILRDVVAQFLAQSVEFRAGTLVTVTHAVVRTDGHAATIFLSVLPEEHGPSVLNDLIPHLYELQGHVNNALGRRRTPHIHLALDPLAGVSGQDDRSDRPAGVSSA